MIKWEENQRIVEDIQYNISYTIGEIEDIREYFCKSCDVCDVPEMLLEQMSSLKHTILLGCDEIQTMMYKWRDGLESYCIDHIPLVTPPQFIDN